MRLPGRAELRAHLVASRIAGEVATPRENNLRNMRLMSERDPRYLFGLEPTGRWSYDEVLALMAERVGVSPDPTFTTGVDTIDPDRTVDRLDAMTDRLARAAAGRERVLVCTGHPGGVLAIHVEVAQALRRAGCLLLRPAEGWTYPTHRGQLEVRFLGGVGMVSARGGLDHTHSPEPMRAMLAALRDAGQPPPDLVVADHGFAGAAGQAGVDAVGFADCNDPALFVGEAEGRVLVAVPLDDNVLPHLYAPVTDWLLRRRGGG